MELFTVALHDLADFVDTTADGRFVGVVEAAQGSAAALAESLTAMPFYRDVHEHPFTGEVFLYKRAQITAQDLAVAFAGEGYGRFDDLDQLTMFADNLVPHVLRVEGVLELRLTFSGALRRSTTSPSAAPRRSKSAPAVSPPSSASQPPFAAEPSIHARTSPPVPSTTSCGTPVPGRPTRRSSAPESVRLLLRRRHPPQRLPVDNSQAA